MFTVLYRQFLFSSFDPEVADVSGVRVARMDALLMLVLSVSILATLSIIGVTLVAATLVIPAVVARMLSDSFSRMLWLSTGIGTVCGAVGMYASYHLEIPSGTTIVLTNALVFLARARGHAGPHARPHRRASTTTPTSRRRPPWRSAAADRQDRGMPVTPRLSPGDPAPAFTLPDADGRPVSLADLAGRRVVLYFYPAAGDARLHGAGLRLPRRAGALRGRRLRASSASPRTRRRSSRASATPSG